MRSSGGPLDHPHSLEHERVMLLPRTEKSVGETKKTRSRARYQAPSFGRIRGPVVPARADPGSSSR